MTLQAHHFQPGNELAKKVKVVDGMIRSVLALDNRDRLRKAIEATLDQAADGSLPHLDWIATRLEGKPAQAVTVEDSDGMPAFKAIRLVVIQQEQLPNVINDIPAIEVKPNEV